MYPKLGILFCYLLALYLWHADQILIISDDLGLLLRSKKYPIIKQLNFKILPLFRKKTFSADEKIYHIFNVVASPATIESVVS